MPAAKKSSKSRRAISAEAYGDWNKKGDFKPRVIPKSEDQKNRLAFPDEPTAR